MCKIKIATKTTSISLSLSLPLSPPPLLHPPKSDSLITLHHQLSCYQQGRLIVVPYCPVSALYQPCISPDVSSSTPSTAIYIYPRHPSKAISPNVWDSLRIMVFPSHHGVPVISFRLNPQSSGRDSLSYAQCHGTRMANVIIMSSRIIMSS